MQSSPGKKLIKGHHFIIYWHKIFWLKINFMMQNTNKPGGTTTPKDVTDSPKDVKEMQEPETTVFNLPGVEDIPGQENIIPAPLGEMADETISADEEADELFGDNGDNIDENSDSNVSETEKEDLEKTANEMPAGDNINLQEASLDNTDDEGTPLNEGSFKNDTAGTDLDVPGTEQDDADEEIGEEDEENNDYSLGGDNHDDIPGDSF